MSRQFTAYPLPGVSAVRAFAPRIGHPGGALPAGPLPGRPLFGRQPAGPVRWLGLLLTGLLLSALSVVRPADAGDPSRVELTDGSVVIGEVTGMRDGWYRVESPTLGSVDIEASRIRVIRRADAAAAGSAPTNDAPTAGADGADMSGQIESLQRQMVGNPDLMRMIMALQQDADLQRAIADPELMGLIASGNLEALKDNPRFRAVMENPGMRAIIEQMGLH